MNSTKSEMVARLDKLNDSDDAFDTSTIVIVIIITLSLLLLLLLLLLPVVVFDMIYGSLFAVVLNVTRIILRRIQLESKRLLVVVVVVVVVDCSTEKAIDRQTINVTC